MEKNKIRSGKVAFNVLFESRGNPDLSGEWWEGEWAEGFTQKGSGWQSLISGEKLQLKLGNREIAPSKARCVGCIMILWWGSTLGCEDIRRKGRARNKESRVTLMISGDSDRWQLHPKRAFEDSRKRETRRQEIATSGKQSTMIC